MLDSVLWLKEFQYLRAKTAELNATLDKWGLTPDNIEEIKTMAMTAVEVEEVLAAITEIRFRIAALKTNLLPVVGAADAGDALSVNDMGMWAKYRIPTAPAPTEVE